MPMTFPGGGGWWMNWLNIFHNPPKCPQGETSGRSNRRLPLAMTQNPSRRFAGLKSRFGSLFRGGHTPWHPSRVPGIVSIHTPIRNTEARAARWSRGIVSIHRTIRRTHALARFPCAGQCGNKSPYKGQPAVPGKCKGSMLLPTAPILSLSGRIPCRSKV